MLVITRKPGAAFTIYTEAGPVVVSLLRARQSVRFGVAAPQHRKVLRMELQPEPPTDGHTSLTLTRRDGQDVLLVSAEEVCAFRVLTQGRQAVRVQIIAPAGVRIVRAEIAEPKLSALAKSALMRLAAMLLAFSMLPMSGCTSPYARTFSQSCEINWAVRNVDFQQPGQSSRGEVSASYKVQF